jgi:anti-sigma-K factor RskA
VVTDHPPDHGPFEELAAGYALDALEPADEQRYLDHARQCPACTRALADFREVAAALADTAPAAEPSPRLGDRILAAALADLDRGRRTADLDPGHRTADPEPGHRTARPADPASAADTAARPGDTAASAGDAATGAGAAATAAEDPLPPGVVPLRPRARRWQRPASIAAAAALIAGGGIWAGLAGTAANPLQPPVASCAHLAGCTEIPLTAAGSHVVAAQLIVDKKTAWMLPGAMKANDTADQTYVLWQITRSHRPLAVGSFDVRAGAHGPIRIGTLAAPLPGTLAFGVSLEHGRTIPTAPSSIAALGQVS